MEKSIHQGDIGPTIYKSRSQYGFRTHPTKFNSCPNGSLENTSSYAIPSLKGSKIGKKAILSHRTSVKVSKPIGNISYNLNKGNSSTEPSKPKRVPYSIIHMNDFIRSYSSKSVLALTRKRSKCNTSIPLGKTQTQPIYNFSNQSLFGLKDHFIPLFSCTTLPMNPKNEFSRSISPIPNLDGKNGSKVNEIKLDFKGYDAKSDIKVEGELKQDCSIDKSDPDLISEQNIEKYAEIDLKFPNNEKLRRAIKGISSKRIISRPKTSSMDLRRPSTRRRSVATNYGDAESDELTGWDNLNIRLM
ncbi:unnamed protein product [Blepharisma stoltei]|uniref:Exophilin 5 n=1 Tax=Blepharisma stoltei TaxID=1481888 RepID=A0AAU9IF03_9CILI|nr:unnamed protein product [Blepharisma stoltei]